MNERFKTAEDAPRFAAAGNASNRKSARDEFPDYSERARRMADLLATPALPWIEVGLLLDIPHSTLEKLRAQGRGPRTFKIGRRLYVRQADLRSWLDELATGEAA